MAKAFIFSIDAFVALTIMLIIIQSVVLISAVPSSYYGGLMQANYLARDTLGMLANANATAVLPAAASETAAKFSMLDYVIGNKGDQATFRSFVGAAIPDQYGYSMDMWNPSTSEWTNLYNTSGDTDPANTHSKLYHKLRAVAYAFYFGYTAPRDPGHNPYTYRSCSGGNSTCAAPTSSYVAGEGELGLVRLEVYR